MKAKIKSPKPPKFEPIQIELTIESLDELNELFHRLHLITEVLYEIVPDSLLKSFPVGDNSEEWCDEIYKVIKYLVDKHNP